MKKFFVRNGLIGTIADDVMGVQDALAENVMNRMTAMIARPGFKCRTDDDFTVSIRVVPPAPSNRYEITCANVGVMVFPDYTVIDGKGATLAGVVAIDPGETVFVQIRKTATYDKPGRFVPGHPVDPATGAPPVSGDNVIARYGAELLLTKALATKPDKETLTLGKYTLVDGKPVFSDMRGEYGLQLVMTGYDRPYTAQPSGLEVKSVTQVDLLKTRMALYPGDNVNVTSPASNQASNRLYWEIRWNRARDASYYELRLTPITNRGVRMYPMYHVVPDDVPGTKASTLIEVCEAMKYEIGVRAVENTPLRSKGPEITLEAVAGMDIATLPMPPPTVSFGYLQGSYPNVVEITTSMSQQVKPPNAIQIFRVEGVPPVGISITEPMGVLIHDGPDGTFRYVIPQGMQCWFIVRARGPAGAVSSCVMSETAFVGSSGGSSMEAAGPEEITIDLPISQECRYDDNNLDCTGGIQLLRFRNPISAGNRRYVIRRLEFHPAGSSHPVFKIQNDRLDLIVGSAIDAETRLVFSKEDFPSDWNPWSAAPNADKYHCSRLRKSAEWPVNYDAPAEFGVFLKYTEGTGANASLWDLVLAGNLRIVLAKELQHAPVLS